MLGRSVLVRSKGTISGTPVGEMRRFTIERSAGGAAAGQIIAILTAKAGASPGWRMRISADLSKTSS